MPVHAQVGISQGSLADEVGEGAAAIDQDAGANHATRPQLHAVLDERAQGRQTSARCQHHHWGAHTHRQPEADHLHLTLCDWEGLAKCLQSACVYQRISQCLVLGSQRWNSLGVKVGISLKHLLL